jgi:mRNA-degrading endonuclease toxin of MazEF toxin-antitoxin module
MTMPVVNPGEVWVQVQTVSTVKLERRLGALTGDEMKRARDALAKRLAI